MSAFIVTGYVVNRICSGLHIYSQKYSHLFDEEMQVMVDKILALNRRAVNYRYNLCEKREKYTYTFRAPETKLQLSKDLSCLLYQCAEGKCDTTRLYRDLEHELHMLNSELVVTIPGYEDLGWGA